MCHTIQDGATVISKGGCTGPNLFGVIGRQAGSLEGFRYGKVLVAAGKAGLVWDAELLDEYVKDPKKFLKAYLDSASGQVEDELQAPQGRRGRGRLSRVGGRIALRIVASPPSRRDAAFRTIEPIGVRKVS
jgi:cytochrome c